nr:MAG TPA: hypothetical protein [Caudoviricetes sp.]
MGKKHRVLTCGRCVMRYTDVVSKDAKQGSPSCASQSLQSSPPSLWPQAPSQ